MCVCLCLFVCGCDKRMDGQTNECMNEVGFACLLLTRCPKAICGHQFPCFVLSILISFFDQFSLLTGQQPQRVRWPCGFGWISLFSYCFGSYLFLFLQSYTYSCCNFSISNTAKPCYTRPKSNKNPPVTNSIL